MRIGKLHAVMLTLSPSLAAAGVISGSTVLAASAVVLIGTLVLTARHLLNTDRSKLVVRSVHAFTVVLLIIALLYFRTSRIDAVLLIVMLGIFNRFVLRGGHRDDFLIVGASAVLMSAATTVTPGVLFFVLVVMFIPATLYALWASMLLGGAEREASDPAAKVTIVKAMASRETPSGLGRIALLGFSLTAAGYAVVSLLPRYTFLQMLGAGYFMALTGTSPTMELRTDGVETLADSTPVIRVEPFSGTEASVTGLYARVQVLDTFDGRLFTASSDGGKFPVPLPADREGEQDMNELSKYDTKETVRVTLNRLVRGSHEHPLAVFGRGAVAEVVRRNVRRTSGGTWMTSFRGTSTVYKARLDKKITEPRLPKHLLQLEEAALLEVPDTLDPRVVELGKALSAGKTTPEEKIDAVMRHLSRGFEYSLEPLKGTSTDPLARFLFEAKKGHCELYAAALAVLLRIGGVKTRVATGYYGGAWNSLGGYLVYTSQDAHAWVEVFDDAPGAGWRWIDATPEDLRGEREKSAFQAVRDWYDAAEMFWFDHVIDFDETKRRKLMTSLTDRFDAITDDVESVFTGERQRTNVSRGWIALLLAVPVGALAFLFARKKQRVDPALLGGRVRRALGAKEEENVTLGVLLDRVEPSLLSEAKAAVRCYEAWRFGSSTEVAPVLAAIATLEAAIKIRKRNGRGRGRGPGSPQSHVSPPAA